MSQSSCSSRSPLNCSSISQTDLSPVDCSYISQIEHSSISSLNCSSFRSPCSSVSPLDCSSISQSDYSLISLVNCSSKSQTNHSFTSPQNCSSIPQANQSFTSYQKHSTKSQTNCFALPTQDCTHHNFSLSPQNGPSILQLQCSTSALCSSSVGQSNYHSAPTTTFSIDCSSTSPSNKSMLSLHGCSPISPPNYSTSHLNQHVTPAPKCPTTCQFEHSPFSLPNSSYFQACDLQAGCSPDISIPHIDSHFQCSSMGQNNKNYSSTEYSSLLPSELNSVPPGDLYCAPQPCHAESSYTSQAQDKSHFTPSGISPPCSPHFASTKPPHTASLDPPINFTPTNSDNPSQIIATAYSCDITHICSNFSSSNNMHSNTVTLDSTKGLQSQGSIEVNGVSYCADPSLATFHSYLSEHHSSPLSTKLCTCPSVCNCPLAESIHPSPTSTVLGPTTCSAFPLSACLTSPDHTVSAHSLVNAPETSSCCHYAFISGASSECVSPPEEQNEAKKCEICKASVENKVRLEQDRQLCELFLNSLSRFEDWLQAAQITASLRNPFQTLHKESKLALRKYEVLLGEMQEKLLDLESLNTQYWRLTQTRHQTLLPSVLRSRMQEVNMFWYHLQRETEAVHKTLKSRVQQREKFDTDQEDMKLCLTEMDLELSSVEYIYGGNSTEKIQQLKAFQEDVWSNMKRVECLLERGDLLIDNSDPRDAETLEEEMTELGSYCQEIFIRLSRLQKRLVSTRLVFEDDFLNSSFEHASSGSSDVFLDLDNDQGQAASAIGVPAANVALAADLEWDPLGDVGRSSSHDGQESFYTATSAPWNVLQRSDGSQSSFSSDFGVTSSKLRSQEVQEPPTDVLTSRTAPWDTCNLMATQKQTLTHRQSDTSVNALYNPLAGMKSGQGEDAICCPVTVPIEEPDSGFRMDDPLSTPGHCWHNPDVVAPVASDAQVIGSQSHHTSPGHRRRQGKKKRLALTQSVKRKLQPAKQEVSILMENGDIMSHLRPHKASHSSPTCLWLWIKRLASFLVLFLLLGGSLLIFPVGRSSCSSQRFAWSLMLTYVNGPPPT
ncbi:uncharacterized protein LOC134949379 [Pseudophryne corroboree]|uniref:uncharacterized protein LOC134949379 n=1 Tax=Pseudophryne corroboree TaxID=495146 RepID=UPI003081A2BD